MIPPLEVIMREAWNKTPIKLRRLTIDGVYMRLMHKEPPVIPAVGEDKRSLAIRAQFEPWFYRKNQQITNPFLSLKDVAKVDLKAIYKRMRQAEKARVKSSSRKAEEAEEAEEASRRVGDEQEEEVRDDQEQRPEPPGGVDGSQTARVLDDDNGFHMDLQPSGFSLGPDDKAARSKSRDSDAIRMMEEVPALAVEDDDMLVGRGAEGEQTDKMPGRSAGRETELLAMVERLTITVDRMAGQNAEKDRQIVAAQKQESASRSKLAETQAALEKQAQVVRDQEAKIRELEAKIHGHEADVQKRAADAAQSLRMELIKADEPEAVSRCCILYLVNVTRLIRCSTLPGSFCNGGFAADRDIQFIPECMG
jgi:hypothetical protein